MFGMNLKPEDITNAKYEEVAKLNGRHHGLDNLVIDNQKEYFQSCYGMNCSTGGTMKYGVLFYPMHFGKEWQRGIGFATWKWEPGHPDHSSNSVLKNQVYIYMLL